MPAFITGNCALTAGTINGVTIGGSTPAAITTSSLTATGGTIDGVIIGGSTAAAVTTDDLTATGGTIDDVIIGGSTPAAITTDDLTATGGTINGVAIGGSTAAALVCTTLTCSSTIDMGAQVITNVGTPTAATHAATKTYVDNLVQGLVVRDSCIVATTAALVVLYDNGTAGVGATLTNNDTQAALTIDGRVLVVGERVLVKNQTDAAQNGIYTVTAVGDGSTNWVLTRATDVDVVAEVERGIYTHILGEGTANGDSAWVLTDAHAVATIGTDDQNFSAFGSVVSLTSTGSTIDISTYDIDVDESHAFAWTGAQTYTGGGCSVTFNSGSFLLFRSAVQLRFGNGSEARQFFAGDDFILENTDAAGAIVMKTGSATNATEFRIVDSANASLMEVKGDGALVYHFNDETSDASGWGAATAAAGHRIIRMDGAALTGDATFAGSEHLVLYASTEGQVLTIVYTDDNNGGTGPHAADLLIPDFIGPGGGSAADTTITFTGQGQGITLIGLSGGVWMSMHGGHS